MAHSNRLKSSLKVFVTVPWLYGEIHPSCLEHIEALECPVEVMPTYYREPKVKWVPKWNEDIQDRWSKSGPCADNVNFHINKFMQTDATHMLMVDADMEIPPHALDALLRLDVDIASGVSFGHSKLSLTTAGRWYPKPRPKSEKSRPYFKFLTPAQVVGKILHSPPLKLATGAFCMLTRRRVFERHHPRVPPLRFRWNPPQRESIDLTFWNDACQYGFTSAIHGGVLCGHLPHVSLEKLESMTWTS